MDTVNRKFSLRNSLKYFVLLTFLVCFLSMPLIGQTIKGVVRDFATNQPMAYANAALFDTTATRLMAGAISNEEGEFELNISHLGDVKLRISMVGYNTRVENLALNHTVTYDVGDVFLQTSEFSLQGVTVEAQRIRGEGTSENNTYLVNKSMKQATHTGTDLLKLIPGVHVDFRQNISLDGNQNILILVNGRERDRSYISQLNASQIDRIEIMANPPAQYDSGISGVINIILNRDQERGFAGHVYAEIPVSQSEVFIFPAYSLNYSTPKINISTSYSGEMSYFDIEESYSRMNLTNDGLQEMYSKQYVNQKNWSHRFHFGTDYFINDNNQLSFYSYYNPFSQEHDGSALLQDAQSGTEIWSATKEDHDTNQSAFFSLFYKRIFNPESGHELKAEGSFYHLTAENTTRFINTETAYDQINTLNPLQYNTHGRIDYTLPLSARFSVVSGMQIRQQKLQDSRINDFRHEQKILASFLSLKYSDNDMDFVAGMRVERATQESSKLSTKRITAFLPTLSFKYKLSRLQSIRFSWRTSVSYPGYYQLNSAGYIEDPYTQYHGNPDLDPVSRRDAVLDYTRRFENHFISAGFFYKGVQGAINHMAVLNGNNILEIGQENLGDLHMYGVLFSGALSLGRGAGVQPSVKVFEVQANPYPFAQVVSIQGRRQFALETGVSAYASLGKGFSATLMFNYASPLNNIQDNYYCGAQYFLSLEKDLGKGFKVGMVSAMPLSGRYTYRGTETLGANFSQVSSGDILLSAVPFWIKFSYQFSKGKRNTTIEHGIIEPEGRRKKGF